MKLVLAIVQDQDVQALMTTLTREGFSATKLASTGGFLREGNSTILIGIEEEKVDQVLRLIGSCCRTRKQLVQPISTVGGLGDLIPPPIEVPVGGATVFVLNVERFEKV